MSGTVAIDALTVDDWEPSPNAAGASSRASEGRSSNARASNEGSSEGPVPPWPRRKLNDALADLGPVRPTARVAGEPWSRSKVARSDAPTPTMPANDDGALAEEASSSHATTTSPATASNLDSVSQGGVQLPPPPRPLRQPSTVAQDGGDPETRIAGWDDFALADDDDTGANIVRALAEANLTAGRMTERLPAEAFQLAADEPLERPPMIIERAIAEQSQGLVSMQSDAMRASPLPGLAVGFSLSVMAGAALYLVLASA